jgi:hypothetical protein
MLAMTTPAAASRILLVEDPDRMPGPSARIRRYRMARLRLNPRPGPRPAPERFVHLKRIYD